MPEEINLSEISVAWAEAMKKFGESVGVFSRTMATSSIIQAIQAELGRQYKLWGQQDHPVYTRGFSWLYQGRYQAEALKYKRMNDGRSDGQHTWDAILLEEVYEALAEPDAEKREAELVQVAAVAVSMVAASKRARFLA